MPTNYTQLSDEETLENSATFKLGVAALFDAAIAEWKPSDLKRLGAEIPTAQNQVEIREDGTLIATVNGRVIFASTEREVVELGLFLEVMGQ